MSKFAAFPEDSPNLGSPTDLRERIGNAIESLLALLDALDGDPDREPSLGAPEAEVPHLFRFLSEPFPLSQERWADGSTDDMEYDVADITADEQA